MKTKIIQSIPVALALLAVGFLYLSRWCTETIPSCYGSWIHHIYFYFTQPLYFFALYILPITIILVFVSRSVFKSWLKLAMWAVPLLLIFISTQPVVGSFLSTNRDDTARLAGEVFTVLSLILIVWKYYAGRRANSLKV